MRMSLVLVTNEWKMYRAEEIPELVIYDDEGNLKRIDSYWDHVLKVKNRAGGLKYPQLTKIVQTCLSIAHECQNNRARSM